MTRPPSRGRYTDRYGVRVNPVTKRTEGHHGLDINAYAGLILVAPEDVVLDSFGVIKGWEVHGRVAVLRGADGWVHWLSHCDRALVPVGSRVPEGGDVAVMGLTGQTTGLHVHWETRHNGQRLDPEAWLARPTDNNSRPFEPEEDDMNAEQDARLKNIESQLSGIINAISDPKIGIHDHVLKAAGRSAEAVAIARNIEGIVAGMQNAIGDPKIGILVVVNAIRGTVDKILAAVTKLTK
ncbi:M23 family metallopeptidase [Microbacterium sp. 2P01SA-2]|uniref:M23 family metallopeptidase n=1 Tax=unclassified Microbacterium TaxID=2609290 RepID=UPI0039A2B5DF